MGLENRDVGVSKNNGTPKSSILIGFSIINHPFWGTPIFGNIHVRSFLFERYFMAGQPTPCWGLRLSKKGLLIVGLIKGKPMVKMRP